MYFHVLVQMIATHKTLKTSQTTKLFLTKKKKQINKYQYFHYIIKNRKKINQLKYLKGLFIREKN